VVERANVHLNASSDAYLVLLKSFVASSCKIVQV
jgi:hypothetical protein